MFYNFQQVDKKKKTVIIGGVLILLLIGLGLLFLNRSKEKPAENSPVEMEKIIKEATDSVNSSIKIVAPISESDHFLGDINAPIQLIVYSDFECVFCAQFDETIKQVKENYSDKAVIAFRHYPLRGNPSAYLAAMASECAEEQGKFWEMHDKLFLNNKNNSLNSDQFVADAKSLGLDENQFEKCLTEEKYRDKIQVQVNEAKTFGVSGAPQSFINGQALPGAYPFEDFTDSAGIERQGIKSIIEKKLETK